MNITLWLLASIGLTHIVTGSSLLGPIRKFLLMSNYVPEMIKQNLTCNQCAGFWVGVFLWLIMKILILYSFEYKDILLGVLFYGPTSSLFADLTYRIKQFICKECG